MNNAEHTLLIICYIQCGPACSCSWLLPCRRAAVCKAKSGPYGMLLMASLQADHSFIQPGSWTATYEGDAVYSITSWP